MTPKVHFVKKTLLLLHYLRDSCVSMLSYTEDIV